jgi:hypothetical protein
LRIGNDNPNRDVLCPYLSGEDLNSCAEFALEARPRDGYNSGGYEWCCTTWGYKWPASDIEVRESPDTLSYQFQTLWRPPTFVIK